ncbi:hypothetical protein ACFO3J_33480 [Streptomyces polygonati]|uniref:Uncharacterized protein n=1 Tax=Streptomyces polygonati TaxID=1617087 RepID=A0ABV8HWE1_9ACTN
MLGRHRAELTGTSMDPALRADARPGERAERWKERLRQAGVTDDNLNGVLGLLGLLFPAVQQAVGNGSNANAAARWRGIGSLDYFDRYVVFTVPADDLPEAAFAQALAQIASGTGGDQAAELLVRLREDTHRIIRRIDQARTDGIPVPTAALLQALADNYGQLSAEPEVLGILGPDRRVRSFAPSLLLDLPPDQRPAAVAAMAVTYDGAVLATRTLQSATNPNDTTSEHATTTEAWAAQARDALTGRLAEHLTPAAGRPATDLTEQDDTLIWMWRHTDPDGIRTWLRDRLDNGWELLPLLAKLIPPSTSPSPSSTTTPGPASTPCSPTTPSTPASHPTSTTPTPGTPPTNTRPTSSRHSATADPNRIKPPRTPPRRRDDPTLPLRDRP